MQRRERDIRSLGASRDPRSRTRIAMLACSARLSPVAFRLGADVDRENFATELRTMETEKHGTERRPAYLVLDPTGIRRAVNLNLKQERRT